MLIICFKERNEFKATRYNFFFSGLYQTNIFKQLFYRRPKSDRYGNSGSRLKEKFRSRDREIMKGGQNFRGFKTKFQNTFWY